MMSFLKKLIQGLIGSPTEYGPDEIRLHTLTVYTAALLSILSIPIYFLKLPEIAILMGVVSLSLVLAWACSKYMGKYLLALIIVAITSITGITLTFIAKNGIEGPALLFVLMSFTLFMGMLRVKYHPWNFAIHIILTGALLYWNYSTDHNFPPVYESRAYLFIDYFISVLFGITAIYLLYRYTIGVWEKKHHELQTQNELNIQLRKSLEEVNSEKDRLFSILAHDVRSPLASIEGVMEIFGRGGLSDQEQKELSSELLTMTRGSIFLVENLLYWSRYELGQDNPADHFHLDDVMKQIELMFIPIAKKKGIQLNFEITPGMALVSHRNATEVLFRNIIHNAIKFSPKGGRVGVHTEKGPDGWHIYIEDDGDGLDPEKLTTINQAYSTEGTAGEKGTGLGLWLVKRLSDRMGYQIQIQRPVSMGTRFVVSIPAYSTT